MRFFAKSANCPFGYFFKYSLKSSRFELSLIEFQKIISGAAALSLEDFSGPVFLAGVPRFVVVVFFGVGVGLATTWPPLPGGVPTEALGFANGNKSTAITEISRVSNGVLNLR